MPTVHVVAQFRAKEGKADALKGVLVELIAPTRRETGCHQYDLLQSPTDSRSFCFVERWESDAALDQHLSARHVTEPLARLGDLIESAPDVQRYQLV